MMHATIPFLLIAVALTACATQPVSKDSLFQDLGGKTGVSALTDQFLREIAATPSIFDDFQGSNISRFRAKFNEFICKVSGGGCTYTGESMAIVHAGLDIADGEFNDLVQALINAMEHQGISLSAQNRLLARLAPLHKDIVQHRLQDNFEPENN